MRVGLDLTSVAAVRESVQTHGSRYLERVYTPRELEECGGEAHRLAARFAAKEAVMKALRPSPSDGVPWNTIQIVGGTGAAPSVELAGAALVLAQRAGLGAMSVSMTHEGDHAAAVVIAAEASA